MGNDRWFDSAFGAPPPDDPARDTSFSKRCEYHRLLKLVSEPRKRRALSR